MHYGICNLGMIPVQMEPTDGSGLSNQLLYGESFSVMEQRGTWSLIRTAIDSFEGWIDTKQFLKILEEDFHRMLSEEIVVSTDLIEFISDHQQRLMAIPLGSVLNYLPEFGHHYDGSFGSGPKLKGELISAAFQYLNAPYLKGGRTPFGIDNSGLTQMVYRLNGIPLAREVAEQAKQGEPLSFIEESEPGDLAFFDDSEGNIKHVGLMMDDNYIIHAFGKVRMDRIDHSGIYNEELGRHTHQLRVIKKIV